MSAAFFVSTAVRNMNMLNEERHFLRKLALPGDHADFVFELNPADFDPLPQKCCQRIHRQAL